MHGQNLTGGFMNNAQEAISSLEVMSSELERLSNEPRNYNTDYSIFLAQLSAEMYRNANELKCVVGLYGDL